MNKSQKIYNKALDKYNKGCIKRSLELCDKSISINIKNKAAINLKGLLLYLKGDLLNARKIWNMNYKVNNDEVAQKYIEGSKDDDTRFDLYKRALMLIKELRINEALMLLEKCAESDFNYIEVNNCSALCHIKRGSYNKALEKINNVFKVDVDNPQAKKSMKLLKDMDVIKKGLNIKKVVCIFVVVLFAASLWWVCIYSGRLNFRNNSESKDNVVKVEKVKNSLKNNQNVGNVDVFPKKNMENYIQNKDYNSMYLQFVKWKDKKLNPNDKKILLTAYKILSEDGCLYFYNLGSKYLDSGDHNNAVSYFKKAYVVGTKSYLYPHITYFLARSIDLSGDSSSALKYYSQYDKSFSEGSYEDTVLYRLAVLYKGMNTNISKNYAQKLVNKYPTSIYNNSVIDDILNG